MIAVIQLSQEEQYTLSSQSQWSGPDPIIKDWLNATYTPSQYEHPSIPSPTTAAVVEAATRLGAEIEWGVDRPVDGAGSEDEIN